MHEPPPSDAPAARWWQKARNLHVVIAALVLVLIGSVVGLSLVAASRSDEADRELADARDQIRDERDAAREQIAGERGALEDQKADLEEEIARLRDDASQARKEARREEKKLARLKEQVGGVERQIEENTIPGTGTYVVGEDIQPGRYRAEASPGCYWARLSSLNTSDIIDNNNADGPVAIEVLATDKALELADCADFVRQGG